MSDIEDAVDKINRELLRTGRLLITKFIEKIETGNLHVAGGLIKDLLGIYTGISKKRGEKDQYKFDITTLKEAVSGREKWNGLMDKLEFEKEERPAFPKDIAMREINTLFKGGVPAKKAAAAAR